MKRNMNEWLATVIGAPKKKAIPVLSFPGIHYTGCTVEELVRDGHKQAECMKAIADHFDTGASVALMDLSVEAEAFGSEVTYGKEDVPTVHGALLHTAEEVRALRIPSVTEGRPYECVKGVREAASQVTDRPVFAGIIGPFSLSGRLLDMSEIMVLCYDEPELVREVLLKATEFLILYAAAFKEAGANGVVMAEPAAGLLSPALMAEFSTPYVNRIRRAVEDESFVVLYHNCGQVVPLMNEIKAVGAKGYSFGNAIDLEKALTALPNDTLILGNIDPAGVIRQGPPQKIKDETAALLRRLGTYSNFVLSSGCDIPPKTPLEHIEAFFEAVHDYYEEV